MDLISGALRDRMIVAKHTIKSRYDYILITIAFLSRENKFSLWPQKRGAADGKHKHKPLTYLTRGSSYLVIMYKKSLGNTWRSLFARMEFIGYGGFYKFISQKRVHRLHHLVVHITRFHSEIHIPMLYSPQLFATHDRELTEKFISQLCA